MAAGVIMGQRHIPVNGTCDLNNIVPVIQCTFQVGYCIPPVFFISPVYSYYFPFGDDGVGLIIQGEAVGINTDKVVVTGSLVK